MHNNPMEDKKYSGLYIVSETACLNPYTGANKHINAGFSQLKKYFNIELCLFCAPYMPIDGQSSAHADSRDSSTIARLKKKIRSFFKWGYVLFRNHVGFFSYLRKVKLASPDFIYERASYLNFNGIIIARWLRIPHMYEVNGILSHDNSIYFPAILNKVSFFMERMSYKKSFGFFIGGINESINIPGNRSFVIQNGIEEKFAKEFSGKINTVVDKVEIVFIGHGMPHHRLDVLVDALRLLDNPNAFRVHLIGSNLEAVRSMMPDSVESFFYDTLSHDEIAKLVRDFHVGIITFALSYYSHVKAFMYGAAKLAMIVPDSRNFRNIFSDTEVLFIKNASPSDLAEKLNYLAATPDMLNWYAENLYKKILDKFTWDRIYAEVSDRVEHIVEEYAKYP